jgi:serine/threonine protein kinase
LTKLELHIKKNNPMDHFPNTSGRKLLPKGSLGLGSYASVVLVVDDDGVEYALKKPFINKEKSNSVSGIVNMKELFIMASIKHPYVQTAKEVFFVDPCPKDYCAIKSDQVYDKVSFLMTRATCTVHNLIKSMDVSIAQMKRIMFQITCSLQYLHGEGICHRDVKPGNVLCYYDENKVLNVKVSDFGMTKPMTKVLQHSLHAGTSCYRAPELLMRNADYDYKIDVWALACTFYEMVTKTILFKGENDMDIMHSMFRKRGTPNDATIEKWCKNSNFNIVGIRHRPKKIIDLLALPPNLAQAFNDKTKKGYDNSGSLLQFCNLMDKMLQINPDDRPTMDEVLLDPFFTHHFFPKNNIYDMWSPRIETISKEYRSTEYGQIVHHFPQKHKEKWYTGASVFLNLSECSEEYTPEIMYSIRFQGLDIYNRVLSRSNVLKNNEEYRKLGWVCGYVASKYCLDEASGHLWDIFPASPTKITVQEICNYEIDILRILDFRIYHHTIFTFLEERAFYAVLFLFMIRPDLVYGKPAVNVMEIFNTEILKIKVSNPNSRLPTD